MKMKLEKNCLNFLLILGASLVLFGCAHTITPDVVKPTEIAYSGNNHNAGFIGFNTNGAGIIDSNAKNKYNWLISIYSTNFAPPIYTNFGISDFTNGTYLISAEGLGKFATMNRWQKNKIGK